MKSWSRSRNFNQVSVSKVTVSTTSLKDNLSVLRQDCDASLTTSLAAQWRAFPSPLIMARLRLLHVFKWRNCKRGGSVSNRGVVWLNVCCGQLDGGEIGF